MRKFGLIGEKLGHSFSKKYFTEKFEREGIKDAQYELYELQQISDFKRLVTQEPNLVGLNVTIPYKQQIISLLDEIDESAEIIGAVNTIKIKEGQTKGFNTDYIGFKETMQTFYPIRAHGKAIVLGTGGAAKAVVKALSDLEIPFISVSRNPQEHEINYEQITPDLLKDYNLIINTTPLGMAPSINTYPHLPYQSLSSKYYAYDLVYNPAQTLFLKYCAAAGSKTMNGLNMLYAQAEAAWRIWNS
jgi:shikimate dehydrogenase